MTDSLAKLVQDMRKGENDPFDVLRGYADRLHALMAELSTLPKYHGSANSELIVYAADLEPIIDTTPKVPHY